MLSVVFFLFGAIFGSAANALIDRLPRNESWFKGRSKCDKCGHELEIADLTPLLSYLMLQGKCRYCHKKIAGRNFWVEAITAFAFAVISAHFSLLSTQVLLCLIFWVTIIIAVMDWETKLVADVMVIIWGVLVLLLNLPLLSPSLIKEGAGGVLLGVGLIGGIWLFSKGKAMGSGDIGIAAVLGWWLGWPKTIVGLWFAFVTGAIYGVYLLMTKKKKLKSEVAFGPWLVVGSWVGWVWGEKIWQFIFK